MTLRSNWFAGLIVASSALSLLASPAPAQQTARKDAEADAMKVIPLQHLSAPQTEITIRKLLGEPFFTQLRMAVDERTNSLILIGKEADITTVLKLVSALDVAKEERDPDKTTIFDLKNLDIGGGLEGMLRVLLRDQGDFAIDPIQRRLLVRGRGDRLEAVRALLHRLEDRRPVPEPQQTEVRFRVVWLASFKEVPKEEIAVGQNPPADLAEVIKELDQIGFTKPRMIAQTLVNTGTNQRFNIKASTRFLTDCNLQVHGTVGEKTDAGRMVRLTISVTQVDPASTLCNVETQITAPSGHPVVLGVTVAGDVSSAFVVQTLPKQAATGSK